MGTLSGYFVLTIVCGIAQVFATQNDHEPMVAFVCGKPAMHRGVSGWISDKNTVQCWDNKRAILDYCIKMYPNHNITNVVETSYLVTIPGWPSLKGEILHDHKVRPFRCIVDSFQSDALLVPQHCKFDHDHDDQVCKGFSHWEEVARNACLKDNMHCESFGMLLNCGLGTFSGVEYVCCPNKTPTQMHPLPTTAAPVPKNKATGQQSAGKDGWEGHQAGDLDKDAKVNLYELYLKGEPMPARYVNEHQRFEAARQYMHKLQEAKNTRLMKEWTAARDHVAEVRKNDPKTANKLSEEIAQRFQRLYSAYEQEDVAEKQQIVALHQQRVQADLNQRKRAAMDKYMRALEKEDVSRINKNLRNYIKTEEKDVVHTVNHYSHVKATDSEEAARIHTHVIKHLKLCQERMEQALEMLQRHPSIERQVRPQIEDFMKKFDDLASRIRNVVLPDPSTSNIHSDSEEQDSNQQQPAHNVAAPQPQKIDDLHEDSSDKAAANSVSNASHDKSSASHESSEEEVKEDEHDYEHAFRPVAHQQHSSVHVQQKLSGSVATSTTAQVGTTFGIAIGSVAIFVVLVVAVVMLRRRSATATNVTHGYVEVDPAASPEERHVANMQMNGYENPTYRYFEVQNTK